MKQYHSVYSPRFSFVVVLLCVLLSLDTTLGSSNHDDLSREEQDQGGMPIELSSGSNGSSSDDSSRKTVMRKATKKTTAPSTPTPTLQMFLERYPEVKDRSAKEQKHLYMVYKLYLNGATSEDLEKYTTNALNFWNCCKDGETSTGCKIHVNYYSGNAYCGASPNAKPYGINTECMLLGVLFFSRKTCCQHWPDNRVGNKAWPWDKCV